MARRARLPLAPSGSVPQRRGEDGRFCPSGRVRRRTSRQTLRGPGWLKSKTVLQLARHLVLELRVVDRLSAELGIKPPHPLPPPKRCAEAIRKKTKESLKLGIEALERAIVRVAKARLEEVSPATLAGWASEELGAPFSVRRLYRHPYDTIWRRPKDFLGNEDIDMDERVRRFCRLTRQQLLCRIDRASQERRELDARCDARLLEWGSDVDWDSF